MKIVEELDKIIIGRVEPYIYAFSTNTIPNYLKVGDTYRPVSVRLNEWKKHYPELKKEYEEKATINKEVFFRDYSVHEYLVNELDKENLLKKDMKKFPKGTYYSKEFFKEATVDDIKNAITDINLSYKKKDSKYRFYNYQTQLPVITNYESTGFWDPRDNQQKAIDSFLDAVNNGRTNLLMYAVMRFGKSFTSLCCAKETNAKTVLIVSAKADVCEEWKKNVQSADNFNQDYSFLTAAELQRDENAIYNIRKNDKGVVIFLTLQDLQGTAIKEKHKELFENEIDLLIVDETHFGARAEKYGEVLRNVKDISIKYDKSDGDDYVEIDEANKQLKELNVKVKLHLSGTPYRLLMGSEFEKEDIISFCQYSDIIREQKKWDSENLLSEQYDEWDNPYFGFPKMIRFAFTPSKNAIKLLENLKSNGVNYSLSEMLKPCSIRKSSDNSHKKFIHENEVKELFMAIDGSKEDESVFPFLNYEKIKKGKMCQHIVVVLPYCASCDALEELLTKNREVFKNLCEYEIVNISGVDSKKKYKKVQVIKEKIRDCSENNKKTITLTVNRMLTGSTVEQWDTMIYLKDTSSPQEYDQAVFRLQNQYIKSFIDKDGNEIKYNMKPQTLLVDFDLHRMFLMQEEKALIYNANVELKGNNKLREQISQELAISPIITMNKGKLNEVEAIDILDHISRYSNERGVKEEVGEIPVDNSLIDITSIKEEIDRQKELGSKGGLTFDYSAGEGDDYEDIDFVETDNVDTVREDTTNYNEESHDDIKEFEKKFRTYYARILFYSFITEDGVDSLENLIDVSIKKDNQRIIKNLGLNPTVLSIIKENINVFILNQLDYKIHNINKLSKDNSIDNIDRAIIAIGKFGRISEAEITTPVSLARKIIKNLPEDCFKDIKKGNKKIIDIASKMGEFAIAIYMECVERGMKLKSFNQSIISVPTSSIAYEFTRKVYKSLGLPIDTIARKFNATDLINDEYNVDFNALDTIISEKKELEEFNIKESEGKKMKFAAIVGNPPYQEGVTPDSSLSKQLFPHFVMKAIQSGTKYVSFITPSRWFAGSAQDKSFLKLREFMKDHNHIEYLVHYRDEKQLFNNVEIKGGVNYFLYNENHTGNVKFINKEGDNEEIVERPLFEEGFDIILGDAKFYSILKKVVLVDSFEPLTNITFGRNAYGIIGKEEVLFAMSKEKEYSNSIPIRCKNKTIRYTDESRVKKNIDNFKAYKVFISKSAGNPNSDRKVIGIPYLGKKKEVCTDSLIPIGTFRLKREAVALQKYLKTKFVRYLVSVKKVSQNVTQIVYDCVPMQDFSNKSDIDWSKTVKEIDEQLYSKYRLTKAEKKTIEERVERIE